MMLTSDFLHDRVSFLISLVFFHGFVLYPTLLITSPSAVPSASCFPNFPNQNSESRSWRRSRMPSEWAQNLWFWFVEHFIQSWDNYIGVHFASKVLIGKKFFLHPSSLLFPYNRTTIKLNVFVSLKTVDRRRAAMTSYNLSPGISYQVTKEVSKNSAGRHSVDDWKLITSTIILDQTKLISPLFVFLGEKKWEACALSNGQDVL